MLAEYEGHPSTLKQLTRSKTSICIEIHTEFWLGAGLDREERTNLLQKSDQIKKVSELIAFFQKEF